MCSTEVADSQVLAHLRRVTCNRQNGRPAYESMPLSDIITSIGDDIGWGDITRAEIEASLRRLREQHKVEVPYGFFTPSCTIRLTKAVQPQLAS